MVCLSIEGGKDEIGLLESRNLFPTERTSIMHGWHPTYAETRSLKGNPRVDLRRDTTPPSFSLRRLGQGRRFRRRTPD